MELFCRPPEVTRAAYDRIRVGMTVAEASAAIGGPPGDYATRPRYFFGDNNTFIEVGTWWRGDVGLVIVSLDANGIITDKYFEEGMEADLSTRSTFEPTWWQRLWWRLTRNRWR